MPASTTRLTRVGQASLVGIADRDVIEPGRPRGGGEPPVALPGVQADVVVVAAGRDKRGLVAATAA